MLYPHRVLEAEQPIVLVRLSGPFDLERSVQTLASLEFPPRRHPWRGLVWDARGRVGYPDAEEIRELVRYFSRWDRVAIVALRDVPYGMGRMASLLSDHVMAFRSLRDGVSWASGGASE